jgi:hypothetical protein
MKKTVTMILLLSSFSFGQLFNIGIFSRKIVDKNLEKVTKTIAKSNFIKNLPDLKLSKSLTPEVSAVVAVGSQIAKKGDFEDKLISKTLYPTEVIRQYAKYGDSYLKTIKEFSQKAVTLSSNGIKNLKDEFPTLPNIKFKTSQEFNDKFVNTLKYTGKKGWETSQVLIKLSAKYPKSTAVGGLYAWYVSDPESFFEQKENLLVFVESTVEEGTKDVTKVILGASSGVTTGFIETIKEKATVSNIFGIVVASFLFVLWKLRSYIKRFFKIKLDNRLEKEKNRTSNRRYNNDEDEGGTF